MAAWRRDRTTALPGRGREDGSRGRRRAKFKVPHTLGIRAAASLSSNRADAGAHRCWPGRRGTRIRRLARFSAHSTTWAPGLVGFFPRTLDDHLAIDVLPTRAAARAATGLGILALVLSAVGLYGLVAWFVELRRREIGVRMALGATAANVRLLIVRQALGTAIPGIGGGTGAGVGACSGDAIGALRRAAARSGCARRWRGCTRGGGDVGELSPESSGYSCGSRDRSQELKRKARRRPPGYKHSVSPRLDGAPCKTRTCDLLVRSQTLYPTELRARKRSLYPLDRWGGRSARRRKMGRYNGPQ